MTPHPMPKMIPYLWKWSLFESVLKDSGEVVPIGDERRALQLFNPGLDGRWATTNSLLGAIQMLLPGETARAHRHTPTAIRFIMEGHGAYTAVDGERVIMAPGDLVLTPSWAWHDHGNLTDERVVWFDGLDLPLIQSLEAMFFELYDMPPGAADQAQQRLRAPARPRAPGADLGQGEAAVVAAADLLLGQRLRSPEGVARPGRQPARRHHARVPAPTDRRLRAADHGLLAADAAPRRAPRAHRQTGSAVYYVERGHGETIIDGQRFVWGKGDVFVLPPWALTSTTTPQAARTRSCSRSRTHRCWRSWAWTGTRRSTRTAATRRSRPPSRRGGDLTPTPSPCEERGLREP